MKIRLEEKHYKWGLAAFLVLVASMIVFFALYRFDVVAGAVDKIVDILMPFVYGLVMAYLLCPIYNNVTRGSYSLLNKGKYRFKHDMGFAKVIGTIVCILIIFIVLGGIAWMILPGLIESIMKVVDMLPTGMHNFQIWVDNLLANLPVAQETMNSWVDQATDSMIDFATDKILPNTDNIAVGISSGVIGAFGFAMDFLIGIIICVYFLNSKDTFAAQMKKVIIANTKEETAEEILAGAEFTNRTFGGFISGKIIDSAIIGILCFIVMSIFGWEYSLLISCIIGITNIIPFFGPFIGAIPSVLLLLMVNPAHALYFIIFVFILQQFDGNILGPKILGESTGLASFWVLFAVLVGGGLMGFVGMIISIPVFAVIYAYVSRALNGKLSRKGFSTHTSDYVVDKYRAKVKRKKRRFFGGSAEPLMEGMETYESPEKFLHEKVGIDAAKEEPEAEPETEEVNEDNES